MPPNLDDYGMDGMDSIHVSTDLLSPQRSPSATSTPSITADRTERIGIIQASEKRGADSTVYVASDSGLEHAMHCLLPLLLALQPAIVIAVLYNDEVMLAVPTQSDVIYTAEFSRHVLGSDSFVDGDRVEAEVRGGRMKVKGKDGKIVTGRIRWKQRFLVHPIPSNSEGFAPPK